MSNGGGSSSESSSQGFDPEAGLATESIMDYSVAEGGAGGDTETYNQIMGTTPQESGPVDPGVAGNWNIKDDGTVEFQSEDDSIKNYFDNLQAEYKANPIISRILPPEITLGKVGLQTIAANYLLGKQTPGAEHISPAGTYFETTQPVTTSDGNNTKGVAATDLSANAKPVETSEPVSVAKQYYENVGKTTFTNAYDQARQQVSGLLGTPSQVGLLGVSESPYYDFLKSYNLNRRII